jgi:hypothetical protein
MAMRVKRNPARRNLNATLTITVLTPLTITARRRLTTLAGRSIKVLVLLEFFES